MIFRHGMPGAHPGHKVPLALMDLSAPGCLSLIEANSLLASGASCETRAHIYAHSCEKLASQTGLAMCVVLQPTSLGDELRFQRSGRAAHSPASEPARFSRQERRFISIEVQSRTHIVHLAAIKTLHIAIVLSLRAPILQTALRQRGIGLAARSTATQW